MTTCPTCGGARHVRTPTGWVRCACLETSLALDYIHPSIRGGQTALPDRYLAYAPYPLKDLTVGGRGLASPEMVDFKGMAWRSLLAHRPPDLMYEYMDSYRLAAIHFKEDRGTPEYTSVRELIPLDLLIIHFGITELPNRMLGPLMVQVLILRREQARPTWVFTALQLSKIRETFSNELGDVLASTCPDGKTIPPSLGARRAT